MDELSMIWDNLDLPTSARVFKSLRYYLGYTKKKDFAKLLDISPAFVTLCEKGKKKAGWKTIQKLLDNQIMEPHALLKIIQQDRNSA